jgi:DNA-binding NtrC family response regulator
VAIGEKARPCGTEANCLPTGLSQNAGHEGGSQIGNSQEGWLTEHRSEDRLGSKADQREAGHIVRLETSAQESHQAGLRAQLSAGEFVSESAGRVAFTTNDLDAAAATSPPHAAVPILSSWIAVDPLSVRLIEQACKIAGSACAVLIRGECGTGKSLLAHLIHRLGAAHDEPFVIVDCATLPPSLMEAELFGSEPAGSDSLGERDSRAIKGRLELAAGTIVLDEFSALSPTVQAHLLQVVEEHRFQRAAESVPAHARVVAITTVDLERAIAQHTLREDLYFRLNVVPLVVPPLRERPADIAPLALHFLQQLCDLHQTPRMSFSPETQSALASYAYPGNVRELKTMVDCAVRRASGQTIAVRDLFANPRAANSNGASKCSLEDLERQHIAEVLDSTCGKKTVAAEILGISRKTLLEKRKRYGLE